MRLLAIHLELAKAENNAQIDTTLVDSNWYGFLRTTAVEIAALTQRKKQCQNKKFNALKKTVTNKQPNFFAPTIIDNSVVNISSATLSTAELNLLNKGLNYSIAPTRTPVCDVIVDIESILKSKSHATKNEIRSKTKQCLDKHTDHLNKKSNEAAAIQQLNEQDIYVMKADKGNKVVVMDKAEYERRTWNLIADNNYKKVSRSPLSKMTTAANKVRKEISRAFGERFKWRLLESTPEVPKLYCLPKIHKPGDKMRQIVALVSAPCTKIAKWLVDEVKKLPPFESCSIKNSIEFAKRIKETTINDDEVLISFDVESLFPSIPLKKALAALKTHLENQDITSEQLNIYMQAAEMCMEMNYFTFRDQFFKIDTGTSMGNPLSPLISEVFMAKFEMDLKSNNKLPRVWHRYVDDVCAIAKRSDINNILEMLNSQYDEINFTYEIEENNKLVFLDLELQRDKNNIEIAIHHKPTSTLRYMTSDSYAPIQHKLAAFHSLAHRLVSLPLSLPNYIKEHNYIKEAAKVNGYSESIVNNIIKRHAKRHNDANLTTLLTQNKKIDQADALKRVSVTFAPTITNGLKTAFRRNNMQIVYSNPFKTKNQLRGIKDETAPTQKSGIYKIQCSDCGAKYYGQTRRTVEKRFVEHTKCIQNNEPRRSAFAAHALENNHFTTTINNVRLLKYVTNEQKLDAYESMYIHKDRNALNLDNGRIESELFNYCGRRPMPNT